MKVDNLEVGMIVKNYKELCTLLDLEPKRGKGKDYQTKEIERHISYDKQGHKFIIKEIYPEPLEKIDARTDGNNRKYDSILVTHKEKIKLINNDFGFNLANETMNSKVVLLWNCEGCHVSFENSIYNALKGTAIKCKECNKSIGARKIHSLLESHLIPFDEEITFPDLKVIQYLRFDYGLLKDNQIIALIEYDGQFHDSDEKVMDYDRIKDNYCETNNIPLLRIHHTEMNHLEIKLLSFLYRFYPSTAIKENLLVASKKIELENQKLLAKVETNNKILKDLLEVIK